MCHEHKSCPSLAQKASAQQLKWQTVNFSLLFLHGIFLRILHHPVAIVSRSNSRSAAFAAPAQVSDREEF